MIKKSLLLLCVILLSCQPETPKKWVAIGDSITYLNDHKDETGHRVTKGYLTAVTEKLPHLQVINKGYNGWTVIRIAENLEKIKIPTADYYSIFLGTNDWWRGNPLGTIDDYKNNTGTATVLGAYRVIIDHLKALNPDAPIVLITPMQRVDFVYINNPNNNALGSYGPKNEQYLEAFAEAFQTIGKTEGFSTVDLYHHPQLQHPQLVQYKRLKNLETGEYQNVPYPDFIGLPFHPDSDEYPYPPEAIGMTYDGLHPSDQGNVVIANALVAVFESLK